MLLEGIEIGAAVHGVLQELETRDRSSNLPTAPTQCQPRSNSISVLTGATIGCYELNG